MGNRIREMGLLSLEKNIKTTEWHRNSTEDTRNQNEKHYNQLLFIQRNCYKHSKY